MLLGKVADISLQQGKIEDEHEVQWNDRITSGSRD